MNKEDCDKHDEWTTPVAFFITWCVVAWIVIEGLWDLYEVLARLLFGIY